LDKVFNRLLFSDKYHEEKSDESEAALMQAIWSLRKELAIYYLRYLDLHMDIEFKDERKVLLAWWMAKKTVFSILESGKGLTQDDMSGYINNILKKEENNFLLMRFRHRFICTKMDFTPSRYLTLNKGDLLSYAVCSLFAIEKDKDIEDNKVLKGLRFPADALAPEISNTIVWKLSKDIITGNSQIPNDSNVLCLRWNIPLSKSVPNFFKKYYGEALKFLSNDVGQNLGEAERVCEFATVASAEKYLQEELPKLSQYIIDDQQTSATLLISLLKVFLLSHVKDDYPQELEIFSKNGTILNKICAFNKPLSSSNCMAFLEILLFLQVNKVQDWTSIFCQQFKNIDYLTCEDEIIELIISYLVMFVMIGGDYDVLVPILNAKKSDSKKVREMLRKMVPVLESYLPYVPMNSRESFRRILNDFS